MVALVFCQICSFWEFALWPLCLVFNHCTDDHASTCVHPHSLFLWYHIWYPGFRNIAHDRLFSTLSVSGCTWLCHYLTWSVSDHHRVVLCSRYKWIGLGLGWESLNASLLEEEGSISLIVLISFWEANTPHLLVLYQMGFMAPARGNLTREWYQKLQNFNKSWFLAVLGNPARTIFPVFL